MKHCVQYYKSLYGLTMALLLRFSTLLIYIIYSSNYKIYYEKNLPPPAMWKNDLAGYLHMNILIISNND